jgi:hypothetical protein
LVGWLVGLLVYSCCSHFEHRTSTKCFISLQFFNLRHSVGLLGQVISLSQGRYLTQTQNKHKQTVHALDCAATVFGFKSLTLLKLLIAVSVHVSGIFVHTICFKLTNFSVQKFLVKVVIFPCFMLCRLSPFHSTLEFKWFLWTFFIKPWSINL